MVKVNSTLQPEKVWKLEELLREYDDGFAWTYKDMKGILLELAQHVIELDTTIPLAHHARYRLNPNEATTKKQNIDKLFVVGFIQHVEEATWLSPIVVILKKNGEFIICVDFQKLNVIMKKDPLDHYHLQGRY
jgi:hypothetical protein